ncbi:mechanosensitive ion channel family protein [Tenacibaculum sp. IB213877]|uniref:mechanosensitive ion channel family protein n=1 Tax=Tenacibaculum sp. IB213877 TaxID=3097351 RepID=UPI002A5AAEB0|nr:mechanosensitive ion channel domain-containing protein [Tenacibaculum sp. IB213877]MDY0781022.1 mechanosensitive ion channel [Tenacibaculum sp. IB213877]
MKDFLKQITDLLNYEIPLGSKKVEVTVKIILILILLLILAKYFLNLFERLTKKRLKVEDRNKFDTIFSFARWFVYIIIFLVTLSSTGVNVTALFAASAALLIGVGLALQTFFQDIISGIFIIVDQTVHVGDIIELDGKVGRVEEIKLRTTRAVTIDNKVLVIPNHLYLTNSLYNWTQNGIITRESVEVGVAYGSDVELVKKLLIKAANDHPNILKKPEPLVLFTNFGDSALNFKLVFTINDSFQAAIPKSDIRFSINKLFKENNISIPFPQRDLHIIGGTLGLSKNEEKPKDDSEEETTTE